MKIKIGDIVRLIDDHHLGERNTFYTTVSYRVDKISGDCVTMLSGKGCCLTEERFRIINMEVNNYQIY